MTEVETMTESKPGFRAGFPRVTWGAEGSFEFRVLLEDRTMRFAFVRETGKKCFWLESRTEVDLTDQVIGWRETYKCVDARTAVDRYARTPGSIFTKEQVNSAVRRHIWLERTLGEAPSCEECYRYYVSRCSRS